ncbi:ADP-ribosylglycohydrolase family protein [Bittarella massiliensis (ex Durand et al. 2017)]|uniref:ADP-ribosylglycohydrolase family protein n=1 Tax=Bittarella massiliensis (ex Durand et al. 2017) TaxID=1720313 RepID=UPI001AA18A69
MFEETFLGGILGFVVGDALGVPVEFESRDALRQKPVVGMRGYGSHGQPAGTWSDDSSMTLCAVQSLTHGLDCDDMMGYFFRWANEAYMTPWGEVFDMGKTTREALGRYAGGTAPLDCGAVSEWENGNGLLMRILPLALYLYRLYAPAPMNWDDVLPVIHNVSKLTHAHPISLIACGLYCCIAYQLLSGAALNEGIWEGITCMKTRYSRYPEYAAWLDRFSRVDADILLSLTEDAIESDGYVLHTLEAVLWCLLHTNSYRDCVLKAVNLGSDTDTVAAIAGGLAGIFYGEDAIPREWLDVLVKLEAIRALSHDFCQGDDDALY